jgi:hypothetical protein
MGRILSREEFDAILGSVGDHPKSAYLAGPFFTDEQKATISDLEKLIASTSYDVISPRVILTIKPGGGDAEERRLAFQYNLEAMQYADLVIAWLDFPDTGTHWELGWAHALTFALGPKYGPGIIGVWLKEDVKINLMLAEGVHAIARTLTDLTIALQADDPVADLGKEVTQEVQ